jgi:hypothetical protein
MLNKIVNAIMAPMESQKPPSVVKSPFDLRRALPTVGASIKVSVFGCNDIERLPLGDIVNFTPLGYNAV